MIHFFCRNSKMFFEIFEAYWQYAQIGARFFVHTRD